MKLNNGITLAVAYFISIVLTWSLFGDDFFADQPTVTASSMEKFAGKEALGRFEENFARLQNAVETLRREQHFLAQHIEQLQSLQSTVANQDAAYHAGLYDDDQEREAINPIVDFENSFAAYPLEAVKSAEMHDAITETLVKSMPTGTELEPVQCHQALCQLVFTHVDAVSTDVFIAEINFNAIVSGEFYIESLIDEDTGLQQTHVYIPQSEHNI